MPNERSGDVPAPKVIVRAAWVAPMDGPPMRDAAIVIAGGRLIDVGDFGRLSAIHPDAQTIDRSDCTILPGLVNAHAHLELSEFACGAPPGRFVDWIARLVPRGQATLESVEESVSRSVPIGVAQCLRFGVTCVADISRHCAVSRPLLSGGPLRVVSYGEVQAMAQRRGLFDQRLATAIDPTFASDHLRVGLTPHAPYSVELDLYRKCVDLARSASLPLATHLAETPDEATFLASHSGPFRELWDLLGAWDEDVPRFAGGPIRFARHIGLLDYPALLAHVNYCDGAELEILSRGRASIVYCPRTHAYFGHPPHRWRRMLASGINVAVGTDSCASSPDLNLVQDLRLLRKIAPDVPAIDLWSLATIRAARAIQMDNVIGSLAPGKAADFVLFGTRGNEPLSEILEQELAPQEVWIDGVQVGRVADPNCGTGSPPVHSK